MIEKPRSASDYSPEYVRYIKRTLLHMAAVLEEHLAFQDRIKIAVEGLMPDGYRAIRKIWVCGPGAFIILKALAFGLRDAPKDAYDLYFVIRNFGEGVKDVYKHLSPLMSDPKTKTAIDILRRHFSEPAFRGPAMVSQFLYRGLVTEVQAEVAGFVRELLSLCEPGKKEIDRTR